MNRRPGSGSGGSEDLLGRRSQRHGSQVDSDGLAPCFQLAGIVAEHPEASENLCARHQPPYPARYDAHVGRLSSRPEIRKAHERGIAGLGADRDRPYVGERLNMGWKSMNS